LSGKKIQEKNLSTKLKGYYSTEAASGFQEKIILGWGVVGGGGQRVTVVSRAVFHSEKENGFFYMNNLKCVEKCPKYLASVQPIRDILYRGKDKHVKKTGLETKGKTA
jgi:hypothetical protein